MGHKIIQKRNPQHLETNKNGNTTHQNLWNDAKSALRINFIAIDGAVMKKKPLKLHYFNLKEQKKERERETSPQLAERIK